MLITAYIISFSAIILLSAAFGIYVVRKYGAPWRRLIAGALTFVAAQILHIPLVLLLTPSLMGTPDTPNVDSLVLSAVVLGLLAGIFEETARYVLFKYILKNARTWREAVVVGAGHGGIEAIGVGLLGFVTLANMIAFRNADLSAIPSIPPEQIELIAAQVDAFWSAPAYLAFLALFERAFAMCVHLALSAMVMYSVAANKPAWFWFALLWHAAVDAIAVYMAGLGTNPVAIEAGIGVMAGVSLWILFGLRKKFGMGLAPERGTVRVE